MTAIAASLVVTPRGLLQPGVVEIDGGTIVSARATTGTAPDRVLVPGFIDLQVNGHDDVDVASAAGADWDRLDALLIDQGVTTWCPTLVTAPLESYDAPLARITAAAARDGARPTIVGAHLEGPFLGGAPGAHRRDLIVGVDLAWIAGLPDVVRIVTLAPEVAGALDAIAVLSQRGIVVSIGHSTATYDEAEAAVASGARMVTHLFNAMAPMHHREPGLAGAALADDRLIAAVIADGVHLHPAAITTAFRAKGRGGVVLVTDAVGWRAPDRDRDVELRDGAPRLRDGTIAGSALTMDGAVRFAVDRCRVPLPDAVYAATTAAADLLGLADRGRIEAGSRADLVALDSTLGVEQVWINGTGVR